MVARRLNFRVARHAGRLGLLARGGCPISIYRPSDTLILTRPARVDKVYGISEPNVRSEPEPSLGTTEPGTA